MIIFEAATPLIWDEPPKGLQIHATVCDPSGQWLTKTANVVDFTDIKTY